MGGWKTTAVWNLSENSSNLVASEKFYKKALYQFIWILCQAETFKLGRGVASKTDEFSEKFQRGGFRSAFFKVCLVLIFLSPMVEKTYPEITLF